MTIPDTSTDPSTDTRSAAQRRRRRRTVGALMMSAASLAVVGASAASLGGVTSPALGADTTVVASCDTDGVTLTYTNTYDATLGRYQTTAVGVTGIDASCVGLSLSITLKNGAGTSLGGGTVGSISGTSESVTLSGAGADASAVAGAAIIIAA
ncbi:MAG: hypothetical protein U0Q22_11405 [Acidimicrobiales bacterium]